MATAHAGPSASDSEANAGGSAPCGAGNPCPVPEDPDIHAVGVWEWDLKSGEVFLDHQPSSEVCWQRYERGTVAFPWLALVHPGDRDRVQRALNAVLAGEVSSFSAEFRTLGPDQGTHLILSRGHCRRDAAGHPIRMVGSHIDRGRIGLGSALPGTCIHGPDVRKFAAAGHAESAVSGVPSGPSATAEAAGRRWAQDKHLRFVEVSADLARDSGIASDTLLGRTVSEVAEPGGPDDGRRRLEHAQRAREVFRNLVVGIRGRDGSLRWIALSGEPRLDANGSFGGYLGVAEDVTATERLRLELSEAEARLGMALSQGGMGLWEWDASNDRFRFSKEARALLGLAPHPNGLPPSTLFERIHPFDRERLELTPAGLVASLVGEGFECRVDTAGGAPRWVALRGVPVSRGRQGVEGCRGIVQDITRPKEAETALGTTEERFRVLLEVSSDYYWEQDEQFRFTQMRKGGFAADLPAREDVVLGKRPWEVDDLQAPDEGWDERLDFLRLRLPFRDVVRRRQAPDGSECILLLSGFPAFDGDGRFIGYRGVSRDVTAEEQARRALRESVERFRALTELSADWYWEQDADLRYTLLSDGYYRLMKIPGGARLGMRRWDIDGDLVSEEAWAAHRALLDAHQPFVDFLLPRRDGAGKLRYHCVSGVPVFDETGQFRGYRGVSRDVTDARAAEEALRRSEQRFRLLAEGMRDVVWISDPALSRIDYINPSVEPMWGISPEELTRDPSLWLSFVLPEDRPGALEALAKQTRGEPVDTEFRILGPDGAVKWLWVRSNPARGEKGDAIVIGITEDVTARKLAQLRDLEEAARQRNALVREVHHRIKNNLQGVAGLLRSHAHRDRHAATALELAIAQIQAIATVHGLQGTNGAGGVEIGRVVEAIAHMLEGLTSVGIALDGFDVSQPRFHLAEEEAVVTALILNELMVNAVKHSDPRESSGAVRVALRTTRDYAAIEVRNRGSLPPDFDLEQRTGLGTGLRLVCALMPKHGLSLAMRSDIGEVIVTVTVAAPVVRPMKTGPEACAT